MPLGKSTILAIQYALLKRLDPSIGVTISEDQKLLTASDVSEETFQQLLFVTNNPGFQNSYMFLENILVYLGNDIHPTEIYGLLPIVKQKIENSDASAYIDGATTHQPFINGFQNGVNIGTLVDALSALSKNTPDTYGIVKKFTLIIDPHKGSGSDEGHP